MEILVMFNTDLNKFEWIIRQPGNNIIIARSELKFDTEGECHADKRGFCIRLKEQGIKVVEE